MSIVCLIKERQQYTSILIQCGQIRKRNITVHVTSSFRVPKGLMGRAVCSYAPSGFSSSLNEEGEATWTELLSRKTIYKREIGKFLTNYGRCIHKQTLRQLSKTEKEGMRVSKTSNSSLLLPPALMLPLRAETDH